MMPKFIGNDSLIARINEVEGCMYRQSNELGRLNKAVRRYKAENAKLRELCTDIWNDALHFEGFWDYVHDDGTIYREDELPHYQERMRECGIEVK